MMYEIEIGITYQNDIFIFLHSCRLNIEQGTRLFAYASDTFQIEIIYHKRRKDAEHRA